MSTQSTVSSPAGHDVATVATRLGVSIWTVYRLIANRYLEAYRTRPGSPWTVNPASVDRHIAAQTTPSRSVTA